MASIELIVDSKDVVTAQTETTKLERNIKQLFDRFQKGSATEKAYRQGLKQIGEEYQKLGVSSQKASGQVQKMVRELAKDKAAQEAATLAKKQAKEAQERLTESNKRAKEEAKRLAQQERERAADLKATSKAMDQHEAEMESLRLKYDQSYRTTKQYEAGLEEIRMAHMAGALSASQMEAEIESLGLEFQKMQSGQKTWSNQFVQGSNLAAKSTNRFGYISQQVGYQVGDFFVQMQSGTNVFVAFGQQATQLAGLLPGLAGAVVGIGISIGTALLAAWSRSKKAAEETSESVYELSNALSNLNSIQKATSLDIQDGIVKAFAESSKEVSNLLDKLYKIEFESIVRPVRDSMNEISADVDKVSIALDTMVGFKRLREEGQQLSLVQKEILSDAEKLVQENLTLAISYDEVKKALNDIGESKTTDDLVVNFSKALSIVENIGGPAAEALKQGILDSAREAGILNQILSSAEGAVKNVPPAIDNATNATTRWANMMSNVGAEIRGIMSSLNQMGGGLLDTAAKAARIKALQEGGSIRDGVIAERRYRFDTQLRKEAEGANIFEKGIIKARKALFEFNIVQDETIAKLEEKSRGSNKYSSGGGSGGSSGGGSGSGDSGVKSFIDMFIGDEDTFQAKREKLDEWFESTMDRYSDFNAAELEILREHNINKLSIEQEYQDRLNEIKRQEKDAQLSHYQNFFGTMASVFESGGSKLLGISKAFALAEAAVSIWRGAAKALELPYPANLAAWANVLATGAKAIQGISSASRGKSSLGGGGAASGGGSIATPANTNASPQKVYIEGLDADSLISGRMLSEIFDKFYEENEERGAVFMVKGA